MRHPFQRRRALAIPLAIVCLSASAPLEARGQTRVDRVDEARMLLERIRANERGPFARLRWFCADGTVHPPQPYPCANRGGGMQHGELSPDARRLGELGYHVGTLFAALAWHEFTDAGDDHDRLREIVVQAFLQRVDDGWDFRRARYYRGARQVEDEESMGERLLTRLLSDPGWVSGHFLLAVELVRAVPHAREPDRLTRIRALAAELGDADPSFVPLRTKIHSYPERSDVGAVADYVAAHVGPDAPRRARFDALHAELRSYYETSAGDRLSGFLGRTPFREGPERDRLAGLAELVGTASPPRAISLLAEEAARLRQVVEHSTDGTDNLRRIELLLVLEDLAFQQASELVPTAATRPRADEIQILRDLLTLAYARGLLSAREVGAQLEELDALLAQSAVTAAEYRNAVSYVARAAPWAQGSVARDFGIVLERYLPVEPRAAGFADDLLRSTVLLPLASLTDGLSRDANHELGVVHKVFGSTIGGGVQGLNPGVATGVLEVVPLGGIEGVEFRPDRIYVLPRSVAELPPVAGILTLEAGNSLSHLQLLARSLGIPNAIIPAAGLDLLRRHSGREVLFAVSPLGAVVLEETASLSPAARALAIEEPKGPLRRVRIDPAALDLDTRRVLTLEALDPAAPRRSSGPKALGVARLRRDFPDHVAPGLVVPIGVYRAHLDQRLSPGGPTLYEEIEAFNRRVDAMERAGQPTGALVTERLAYFRERIENLELDPDVVASLRRGLAEWGPAGSFGVFVRSDTNVEDLAEFSGAGLNRTVPNVLRFEDILDAIREVWASPFTERAYAWRRPVIENPELTLVSVLIQKSVPVEKSGVLVTADLESGARDRLTVTVSEGVGGGVGGERSETLLVPLDGEPPRLLQLAKAAGKSVLRMEGDGGIVRVPTSGAERVLEAEEIDRLVALARDLERRFTPAPGPGGRPLPWDVEFGFLDGKLWLFQIRPLAASSETFRLAGLAALDRPAVERAGRPVDLTARPRP